jgi:hypothetical protein
MKLLYSQINKIVINITHSTYKYIIYKKCYLFINIIYNYRFSPVFTGNTFQDLPRLSETADNTERYT